MFRFRFIAAGLPLAGIVLFLGPLSIAAASPAAGVGIAFFDGNAPVASPLEPMDPRSAEAALATEQAQIDPLFLDQLAERQVLWVRSLIARGAGESAIRAGLDGIAAWARKEKPMRAQAADIRYLENRARSSPNDAALRVAIARYWLRELERERADIPSDKWSMFRINTRTGQWQCTGCYAQRGPTETASSVFPKANAAVQAALQAAPNDPGALFQAALLWTFLFQEPLGTAEARALEYAQRAAAQKGPEAAAARVYALERDDTVAKLRQRVGQLRGDKAVSSKRIVTAYDTRGQRAPQGDVYKPVFRKATPAELAEADATARQAGALEAKQNAELEAALRDYPTAVDVIRLLAERPLDHSRPWEPQWREKERVLRYAILLDPTDWRLHLDRAANWNALGDRQHELPSAEAQAVLRRNRDGDFLYIYDQEAQKLAADPFTAYSFALQAVRRDPASPFPNQRLAKAAQMLIRHQINGVPILPDAFQEAVLQMKVTYYATLRHLAHPEDWRDASTKQSTLQLLDWTKRQIAAIPAKPPQ